MVSNVTSIGIGVGVDEGRGVDVGSCVREGNGVADSLGVEEGCTMLGARDAGNMDEIFLPSSRYSANKLIPIART